MTQTTTTREAMLNATRGLQSVRISEIVLRTSNYQQLKDWYQAFLGVDPYLDNERACFRRLHDDYPYQQLFVIFNKDVKDQTDPVGASITSSSGTPRSATCSTATSASATSASGPSAA